MPFENTIFTVCFKGFGLYVDHEPDLEIFHSAANLSGSFFILSELISSLLFGPLKVLNQAHTALILSPNPLKDTIDTYVEDFSFVNIFSASPNKWSFFSDVTYTSDSLNLNSLIKVSILKISMSFRNSKCNVN